MNTLIDRLRLNSKNPRKISPKNLIRLKEKIRQFPEMLEKRPIVYDENFIVLGGNQRLKVLQELAKEGFEIKSDYFKSAAGWNEEQKRKFVILDNIADGDWDYDLLADNWGDLPLAEWGVPKEKWQSDVVEDQAPEVSDEVFSKNGEIYQLGKHKLLCGDSQNLEELKKLMSGEKARLVFTDPPYNVDYVSPSGLSYDSKKFGGKGGRILNDNLSDRECLIFYTQVLKTFRRLLQTMFPYIGGLPIEIIGSTDRHLRIRVGI